MKTEQPVQITDGPGAIEWMRGTITKLTSTSLSSFSKRSMSLAGMPLELHFDDAAMADDYCVTVLHEAVGNAAPTRLYILSHPTDLDISLPVLDPQGCSEAAFQEMASDAGLRVAYPHNPNIWKFLDTRNNVGVQVSWSRKDLPPWDATAPLRHHLHWILDLSGQRFAHAATLGLNGKGVVLFGPGGAGKSGTTLAGLCAGLQTVGDDYVALGLENNAVARPLFRVVKQDRAGLARNPSLASSTTGLPSDWRGKVAFDPSEFFADAFVDRLELGAIILPRIAHVETPSLRPARPQEAMLALVTSNLHQFPAEMKNGMSFFASLLRKVPCFHLDLSHDAGRNGDLIKAFIADGFPIEGTTSTEKTLISNPSQNR